MNVLLAEVEDVMNTLFKRHPALCGFSVREDLSTVDVACHPALSGNDAQLLLGEISTALYELLDQRPEAAELLRGRTHARTFH